MSTNWHNLMKQMATLQATTGPLNMWKDLSRSPGLLAFQKSVAPITNMHQMLHEMFKRESSIHSMKTITDALSQRTIRSGQLINPVLWETAAGIAKNQHKISSLFSKNLSALPMAIKAQAATPSFLTTAFDLGYTSKLAMMQEALKGVSRQITVKGFASIDAALLRQFQERTSEAVALTEEITERPIATAEAIDRLEKFVETSFETFRAAIEVEVQKGIQKSQKSGIALANLWAAIIGIILTIITIVQFYQSQNEPAKEVTIKKEQVEELKVYVEEKFQKALEEATVKVRAMMDCHLRYHPNSKSSGFFRIKAGEMAHIIEARHKWIRIMVLDPADNLPVSGWVLKKKFIREK